MSAVRVWTGRGGEGWLRVARDTFTGQYGTGEWLMVRGTSTINNQPFPRTRWLRYKMSTPAMT